jgi:hypothetical protein
MRDIGNRFKFERLTRASLRHARFSIVTRRALTARRARLGAKLKRWKQAGAGKVRCYAAVDRRDPFTAR